MSPRVPSPDSRFQVSLRQLFWWLTAVAVDCALAQWLISYLRRVEAENGAIPPETIGRSMFLGFLILAAFVGLMLGPPLCYVLALWRSRPRYSTRPD